MEFPNLPDEFNRISQQLVNRRTFMRRSSMVGAAAVAAPLLAGAPSPRSLPPLSSLKISPQLSTTTG
jgi:hypothetical protein